MREHMGIFRGKRIDNGEWIEGSLWLYGEDAHIFGGPDWPYGCLWHKVDPDTVGECTGLTDKNGKLIFEGDIISIRFESDYEPPSAPEVWFDNATVIWCGEHLGWYASFEHGDEISMWKYDNYDDIVVCGTVHDNPELLKGGEGWWLV